MNPDNDQNTSTVPIIPAIIGLIISWIVDIVVALADTFQYAHPSITHAIINIKMRVVWMTRI